MCNHSINNINHIGDAKMFGTESLGYVNRNEARELLKISDSTLQRWTKLGLITKHKVRGRVFYKKQELKEAVESNIVI